MNWSAALMKDYGSLNTEIIFTNKVKKNMRKKNMRKKKKTPGLSKKITKILKRERSSKRATTFLDPNYSELETERWGRNWYGDYWLPNYTIDYDTYNPCDLINELDSDVYSELAWRRSWGDSEW